MCYDSDTMVTETQQLVARARLRLASLVRRCKGDPDRDPLARKVQQLEARRKAGLPLSDPEIREQGLTVHADLEAARKSANQAVLEDE